MKIEDVIKTNTALTDAKKIILNVLYTQNIVAEKFHEILKPFEFPPSIRIFPADIIVLN